MSHTRSQNEAAVVALRASLEAVLRAEATRVDVAAAALDADIQRLTAQAQALDTCVLHTAREFV
ncbi:hypothetical protein EON66_04995 [archaeon]|nr:MAG: hypothetical protein EON66_04995 [archaeon]